MKNKNPPLKRTSITEKMILYFLSLGIGAIVIIGSFSFFTSRKALLERTYDQLTSIRLARQTLIEQFFADRLRETDYYAHSSEIEKLTGEVLTGRLNNSDHFFNNRDVSVLSSGNYAGFMILDLSGKVLFTNTPDTLPDADRTDMISPLPDSSKAGAFMVDYPATGLQSSNQLLSASAIRINGRAVALLALIVRPGEIDEFMLEVDPAGGLGYSGETYLVGPDYLMRSQSRFIRNSVMLTPVRTIPAMRALENKEGIAQVIDYRGLEVLSSYGQLQVSGLNWIILAEIDLKEATVSIYTIRNNILLLTVFIGLAFFTITYAISRRITRPLIKLKTAAVELGEGRLNRLLDIESYDEIGELTEAFNRMSVSLLQKDEALQTERMNRLKSAIDGQDQERQRLSRELHDGIGQSLIAIRLRLGALENTVPTKTRLNIQSVITLADNLIDEVRAISNALMPPSLVEFGLSAAIRNLCNNLTETNGIKTSFEGEIPGQILGKKASLYIFRIFQETMNNAAKHSEATTLTIESQISDNTLNIRISDNGKGFDQKSPCVSRGHGLGNILERASLMKGEAFIISQPGVGTTIEIVIPVHKNTP